MQILNIKQLLYVIVILAFIFANMYRHRTYLLFGSNLGNRLNHIKSAVNILNTKNVIINQISPVYQTAAWGLTGQNDFLNVAAQANTNLSPQELLQTILQTEKELGRLRGPIQYSPRTIDIDILLFDSLVLNNPDLIIPHPQLTQRAFALVPLNDLTPEYIHPVYKKSIHQLLIECTDTLPVNPYTQLSSYNNGHSIV